MDKTEHDLIEDVAQFYDDPLGFVLYAFPWGDDPMINQVAMPVEYQEKYSTVCGPDKWAIDFLETLGNSVREANDPSSKRSYPLQFSTASGHGIGKTTLVAWLILWIMSTRPFCKGVVTANTAEQLRSKTWSELSKWLNICITKHWFIYHAGRGNMKIVHKDHPEEWNCQAQTSKEENSEAFAGLHAANSTPFYIFDEASAIPDKIFEVREGGTTDGEAMTFDFGNPTRNGGMFFENTVGKFNHNYITTFVDSREVAITNKDRINQWIEDRGLDSDFVKVRVRGVFPSVGAKQFINSDDVQAAMTRELVVDPYAPLVIGVDIARFGGDDTVIYPRFGRDARSFKPTLLSGFDTVLVTGQIIDIIRYFRNLGKECVGLFVDGGGLGAGVVDQLRHLGYNPFEVLAQHRPNDPNVYRYKTDEMWGCVKDAVRDGLCLPLRNSAAGAQLYSELTQREFDYTLKAQISLESKSDMKDRGLNSPNIADALALTYAFPVERLEVDFLNKSRQNERYQDLNPDIWPIPDEEEDYFTLTRGRYRSVRRT